jgi:imidazolonepropionase
MGRTLIKNIGKLLRHRSGNQGLVRGKAMAEVPSLDNAYLIIEGEIILENGPMASCPSAEDAQSIDMAGDWILPGFVDSHTHIVFATSRSSEFVQRIQGRTYEEIAAAGGGILNSARRLADTSEEDLLSDAYARLQEVTRSGTVAIEIKSGYGLNPESEYKMLRVIRSLKDMWPGEIKATFLGAHAIPAEYKNNRSAYIHQITQEMLPYIAAEGLADYCDVFCDTGFFTPAETDQILQAAKKHGLKPKIHANELGISGGVQAGVRNQAVSVDHLECIGKEEMGVLMQSDTIPTLLPNTSFFLGIPYAPARQMIDFGLGVALASDFNPGSAPGGSMLFVLAQGCIKMKMLPEEALNAVTVNGACALELEGRYGSMDQGKVASFLRMPPLKNLAELPYFFNRNPIKEVWIKGKKYTG